MRFQVMIGGVCAAGLLAAVACGSSESTSSNPDDGSGGETNTSSSGGGSSGTTSSGGSSGTSSSGGSSGASSSGTITIPAPKSLKAGGALLLGTTSDDQVIYLTVGGATNDLEAVPIAGGTPVTIVSDFDIQNDAYAISGGAVAWWTNIANDIGTINVWNKTDGVKTALSATSSVGMFVASSDGLRVAWSTAADATSSNIRVSNLATATSGTGFLAAVEKVNLAALGGADPTCGHDMSFVGKKLITAHCVGTSATATDAHLFVVPDTSTTEVRLDDKGTAAGVIKPFWLSDEAGNKLYVVNTDAANTTGRVIDLTNTAAVTSAALEDGSGLSGFVTKDGSAVVYRTATGGIRRTATGTIAPKTIFGGAKIILESSNDQTKMLVATLAPTAEGVDIRSIDTTTENQTAKDIVTTASAQPIGFTGSGNNVLYVVSAGAGVALKVKPSGGGTEKELAKDMDAVGVGNVGDGLVILEKGVMQGQLTLYEVRYIDAATGNSSAKITDGVPDSGYAIVGKKLVYTKIAATGAGLYVVDLP